MAFGPLYYLISMDKTSQNNTISNVPFYSLVDALIIPRVLRRAQMLFFNFWSFMSKLNSGSSRFSCEKQNPDVDLNCPNESSEYEGNMSREEVEMVMGKLGIFCNSEGGESIKEKFSSNDMSRVFDEREASLEEVKEAFDVFDRNKDGFIDAMELQRVLCLLGLKEATEEESCKKMIGNFDVNGDGRIDFTEFVKVMQNSLC